MTPREEPNPCKDIVINDKVNIDVTFHNKHIRFENLTSEQAGYLIQVSEFYQLSSTKRSAVVPQEEPKQYPIGGYAPGSYSCTCVTCKTGFMGDKRAVQCEPCAIQMTREERKQETHLAWYLKTDMMKKYGHDSKLVAETLEEAAEKLYPFIESDSAFYQRIRESKIQGFIEGAKWQADRMYSEEEVLEILCKSHNAENTSTVANILKKQFEQHKKK